MTPKESPISPHLAQIKRFIEIQYETEAVTKAAREFLRMTQLRELKAVSGKIDYCDAGDELEVMELRELPPKSV